MVVTIRTVTANNRQKAFAVVERGKTYRLLDQTNYRKSMDQVLSLLTVLDCDVDLVVRARTA